MKWVIGFPALKKGKQEELTINAPVAWGTGENIFIIVLIVNKKYEWKHETCPVQWKRG